MYTLMKRDYINSLIVCDFIQFTELLKIRKLHLTPSIKRSKVKSYEFEYFLILTIPNECSYMYEV